MSYCSFIATERPMREIHTPIETITVREAIKRNIPPHELVAWEELDVNAEVLVVENEDDLHELTISADSYYDVSHYSSYPYVYEVSFRYSNKRLEHLLHYLHDNIEDGQIIELWNVWLGDDENVPYERCHIRELTVNKLDMLYNHDCASFKPQYCLVIEK